MRSSSRLSPRRSRTERPCSICRAALLAIEYRFPPGPKSADNLKRAYVCERCDLSPGDLVYSPPLPW